MKSKILYLLLFCGATMGLPGGVWGAPIATTRPAVSAALGTAAAPAALNASERASLAMLEASASGLQSQRAGDLYVGDDGRRHWHRGYSYGLGAVLVTALLVVLLLDAR